jgi:hypothetical protein
MHRLGKYAKGSLAALGANAEVASHLLTAIGNARRLIVLGALLGGERFRYFDTIQPCGDFLRANEADR